MHKVIKVDKDGNIEWQSHVCYYLDTTPANEAVLIRKRTNVAAPGTQPPEPSAEGHTAAFFLGAPGAQIVARGVVDLTATIDTDTVSLSVTGSTESRGQFEMTVVNRVFPRN